MQDALLIAGCAFVMSALGVWLSLIVLRARVMDMPEARSNHTRPTPRGAGTGLLPVLLLCLYVLSAMDSEGNNPITMALLLGALFLMVVSFADDVKGLPVRVRLAAQLGAAVFVLASYWHGPLAVFSDPFRIALAVCITGSLLWFINLYNFMDGIDGITGVQTASLGIGIFLVSGTSSLGWAGLILAFGALGFLLFNWHPARIFMGDSGSIPLGLLLGVFLWLLAFYQPAAALILPAYYLLDSTVTILRRAWRKERLFEAHSQHFYQQAVRGGWSHRRVSAAVGVLNACLIGLALLSTQTGFMGGIILIIVAYGLSAATLAGFARIKQEKAHATA